jgi:hypothetical protein
MTTYNLNKRSSSLCLIKHQTLKAYGDMNVELYAFLTSALDGDEWSALYPGCFNPVDFWILETH